MKRHIEILLLAAFAMTAVQCSMAEIEDNSPDRQEPSGKTVTLTVNSSSVGTRTALGENGEVLWETGDEIYINGAVYSVTPDADNPTSATIENVLESDEYLAISPAGHAFTENSNLYFYISESQPYREGSFAAYTNPMVAYSGSTDLYFRNLAGIIRIGITGVGTISRITLSSNDVYSLSGNFEVPMDDIISGNLQNYNTAHSSYYSSNYVYMDTRDEFVLDQGTPRYAYFVIPAATYETGFTVSIESTDGKRMIQSTFNSITVNRSEIVPMETFEFSPFEDISISAAGATATSVDYQITAEPGSCVSVTAVTKSMWDYLVEANPEAEENDLGIMVLNNYMMISMEPSESHLFVVPESGTVTKTLESAYSSTGLLSAMTAETDYVLLAAYHDWTQAVGTVYRTTARTEEASGSAPGLEMSVESYDPSYSTVLINFSTTDATQIRICAISKVMYDSMTASGKTAREIAIEYGNPLNDSYVSEANSGGASGTWGGLDPATTYIVIILATGEGGMETLETREHTTDPYLPAGASWNVISTDGYLRWNLLGLIGSDITEFSNLTIEQYGTYDIFRIVNPFAGLGLEELADTEIYEGYITLDCRNGYVLLERSVNYIGISYEQADMSLWSMPDVNGQGEYGTYIQDEGRIDFGDVALFHGSSGYYTDPATLWFEKPDDITEPGRTGLAIEPFRRIPQEW